LTATRVLSAGVAPLTVGDLQIDALGMQVRQGVRDVHLAPTEHSVLYLLAANVGATVTYSEFATALGKPQQQNNVLARHIHTLRGKLGDQRATYIETIPAVGYRLMVVSVARQRSGTAVPEYP
jgi:DNA-binding response OmpR family regulator